MYGVNFLPQGYVGQHVPQHGSAGFDIDQSIGGQGLVGDGAGVVLAWQTLKIGGKKLLALTVNGKTTTKNKYNKKLLV